MAGAVRLGFTGTGKGMTDRQKEVVRHTLTVNRPTLFVHGGCTGADDQADAIAAELGIHRVVFPSSVVERSVPAEVLRGRGPCTIAQPQPGSPLLRNPRIVAASDLLLACPQQPNEIQRSGTWATVRCARRMARPVVVITP